MTRLRPAKADDHGPILDLMVAVIDVTLDPAHRADTVKNVTANLDIWAQQPEACVHLVATDGDALVGVILVKHHWNLCSLFVRPSWQRSGIGRQLVRAAIDACRGRSPHDAVYLNAAPNAVGFYQRLGFRPRPTRQPLPPGFQAMGLALSPPAD